jgi:hypothetical protein
MPRQTLTASGRYSLPGTLLRSRSGSATPAASYGTYQLGGSHSCRDARRRRASRGLEIGQGTPVLRLGPSGR